MRLSWFLWIGKHLLPLEQVWPSYQRRYSMKHCYRFQKQSLLIVGSILLLHALNNVVFIEKRNSRLFNLTLRKS
jgi:hypothetical protein